MSAVQFLIEQIKTYRTRKVYSSSEWEQIFKIAEQMENERSNIHEIELKLAFETGRNFQLTGENNFEELIEQLKNK